MGIFVGIDLGTTFSAVARIDPASGKPVVIKNSFDEPITPSVLCFREDGSVLFGEDAKNEQAAGNTNACAFFKRYMGNDSYSLDILGKTYTATDLSSILLSKLKWEAERQSGETIDAAVITVPAYFSHKERTATMDAAKMAGLNVLGIINEPTAAAFAYGLNEKSGEQTILIYDLGGGTFDVSLASINSSEIRIIGCDGNHELGGKDWDDCIARYLATAFYEKYDLDISEDAEAIASLLVTAENVKKQLTSRDSVSVPITFGGTKGMVEITEQTFEEISQFLINSTKDVIDRLFESVGMSWERIDGVILVGGSTRMRMIHKYVRDMCGKDPLSGVNVDEAVALGAAIRANITEEGVAVAAIGGKKGQQPMMAIRGAKKITDATAHSLGMIAVSTDGESYINSTIIKKNSAIPASAARPFSLRTRAKDNELEVYVLQGEFRRPLDNTIINKYVIYDIRKTNQPESVIEVTYRYTENGVVEVSAVQTETGKNLPIRIEPVPEDMSWTDRSPKENTGGGGGLPSVDVVLCVDLSGSMCGSPIRKAMNAMNDFVKKMNPACTRVGLIGFADKSKVVLYPTDDYAKVHAMMETLPDVDVGACNDDDPFNDVYEVLNGKHGGADIKYAVVLTDGIWYEPDTAIARAKKCHQSGIEVMALGFGTARHDFLKKIASTDEFASLTSLSDLGGSFSKIAQAIGEGSTGLSVM